MRWLALLAVAVLAAPGAASAQVDLFGRDTVQGLMTLGADYAAGGPKSWTEGGFGKTRFDRGAGAYAGLEAVWRPQLTSALSAVVDGVAQPRFSRTADVAEAYLLYKPIPAGPLRYQARAGLLYPPVSLEHDDTPGEPWTVRDTLTPSAIDSWLGEEVKALGGEGRLAYAAHGFSVSETTGLFGRNDTSGALLALRGWSFSDLVDTGDARLPLPPLNDYITGHQAYQTEPSDSLDGRIGIYSKLELRTAGGALVNLAYYDNNALVGPVKDGQWGWLTRFYDVGAEYPLGPRTVLSGQAMTGRTVSLFGHGGHGYRFDVQFRSAYLKLTQTRGPDSWTVRVDVFATQGAHPSPGDRAYQPGPLDADQTYSENGWAALAAWRRELAPGRSVLVELMQVNWKRRYLTAFDQSPLQAQTVLQAAFRQAF